MKLDKFQEKLLLARLRSNDPDAYTSVYNAYIDKIYSFIFFKVSTHEEAEDITSDVFLRAWQYITSSDRDVKNLNAFLYQIARNAVIDYYRSKSRVEIVRDEDIMKNIEDQQQQRLLKEIDVHSDFEKVEKIIKTLKDEYKDVVLLRYVEELSISEISNVLNKSKGSVRVLIHRAIKLIKDEVEK